MEKNKGQYEYNDMKLIYIKLKEDENYKKLKLINDLIIRNFMKKEIF